MPCTHAIATMREHRVKVEDYIDECYSTEKYKKAYARIINPINCKNLWQQLGVQIHPPEFKDTKKNLGLRGALKKGRVVVEGQEDVELVKFPRKARSIHVQNVVELDTPQRKKKMQGFRSFFFGVQFHTFNTYSYMSSVLTQFHLTQQMPVED